MDQPPKSEEEWTSHQQSHMMEALKEAECARQQREVPVGCVIVRDNQVIARGHNLTNESRNGTRHAEFQAIDQVLQQYNGDAVQADFSSCQLYVTVEPCIMCAGALSLLGIGQVTYGCGNDRFGGCGSIMDVHNSGCGSCGSTCTAASEGRSFPSKGGLFKEQAIKLLQDFYVCGNPAAPKPHRRIRPQAVSS